MYIGIATKKVIIIPNNTELGNSLFSNLLLNLELIKIVESWADPGHRATTSSNLRSESQVACTFIEKYPFLFLKTSGSSPPKIIYVYTYSITVIMNPI